MRLVFMGSAAVSCACLARLVASPHRVVGVISQPARPRGRRLQVTPSPVQGLAAEQGLPILLPESVNTGEAAAWIRERDADLGVVVAYGQILRQPVLTAPRLGCVNLHASLLPKYRGAAPVPWAIARGETATGMTTMQMNERMDAGAILLQAATPIGPDETAPEVWTRLEPLGADLLVRTIDALAAGRLQPRPQDDAAASLAPKLTRDDGWIRWPDPARAIHDRVRAFLPWPAACCRAPGGRLRVLRTRVVSATTPVEPGAVLALGEPGPVVATGDTAGGHALCLLEVQPDGGRVMRGVEYANGHRFRIGDRLLGPAA